MYSLMECRLLTAVFVCFLPATGYLCSKYIQAEDLRKTHITFITFICIYTTFSIIKTSPLGFPEWF